MLEMWRIGALFSEDMKRRIGRHLRNADISISPEDYLGYAFILSILPLLLVFVDPILAIMLSLSIFSISLYLPILLSHIRGRVAEWELPFFLKSLSTLVRSGIDPIRGMEIASKGRKYIENSMKRILSLHKGGLPLKRALEGEASTYTSDSVRKTLEMLSEVIEGGTGWEALERYADSLLMTKKLEIREFSSKLSLYTLMFIALTALVPSILIIYTHILPIVFGTPQDVRILYFTLYIVLPMATVVMLVYIARKW